MTYDLIIFDMDGTLVDSSRLLANAINHVRGRLDLPPMPHEAIIGAVNDHHLNPARYFYESEHFLPIHEQYFSEYYTDHHTTQLALYEGVKPLLESLKSSGVALALATNAHRVSALESLKHLGIASCFDTIACHDDVPHSKPAPDMLYHILEAVNVPTQSALFVGDGPRDEEAAEAAGIDYLMVDWGFTEHAEDKRVVRSVKELQKILGQ